MQVKSDKWLKIRDERVLGLELVNNVHKKS